MISNLDSEAVRSVVVAGYRGDLTTAKAGLGHRAAEVRVAAIGALIRLGAYPGDQLVADLSDPDLLVRRRAAEAAPILVASPEDSGNEAVGDALIASLGDPEALVVEMAAWSLGELVPPPAGAIASLSATGQSHDDPLCREAAIAALGSLGHPDGLQAILAAMDDIATVRRRAVLALAPFDTPEVDEALTTALDDRDWQVRQGAEDLLGQADPDEAEAPQEPGVP